MLVTLMIPMDVMSGEVSPKQYRALVDAAGNTVTLLFLRGGEAYLERVRGGDTIHTAGVAVLREKGSTGGVVRVGDRYFAMTCHHVVCVEDKALSKKCLDRRTIKLGAWWAFGTVVYEKNIPHDAVIPPAELYRESSSEFYLHYHMDVALMQIDRWGFGSSDPRCTVRSKIDERQLVSGTRDAVDGDQVSGLGTFQRAIIAHDCRFT